MAAFIIKWVMENDVTEEKAVALPAAILLRISVKLPKQLSQQFEPAKQNSSSLAEFPAFSIHQFTVAGKPANLTYFRYASANASTFAYPAGRNPAFSYSPRYCCRIRSNPSAVFRRSPGS